MAIINVDDAYILDETGAEVDKVTGLFTKDENTTDAEKAFAQLNIGGGGGGRNLLDNPFFTVRQRGDGPFSSGYTADRWGIFGGIVTVALSGSGFSVSASVGYNIQQRLPADLVSFLNGKVVTLSCIVDGVLYSATGTLDTAGGYQLINTFGNDRFAFVGGANPAVIFTHTTAAATHSYTVSAVKLELGSVSTLSNDAPPKYKSALDDCQWYCRVFESAASTYPSIGYAASETLAIFYNIFGGQGMDKTDQTTNPTATMTGSLSIRDEANNFHTITALETESGKGFVNLRAITTGLTVGQQVRLNMGASGKIVISADL